MFWRKRKHSGGVLGERLDQLAAAINTSNLVCERQGDTLIATNNRLVTRLEVRQPPPGTKTSNPIETVFDVRTQIPADLAEVLLRPKVLATANTMATLGALTLGDGGGFIGSRLTVFEGEDAWNIQGPLLLLSIVGGPDCLIGGVLKAFAGHASKPAQSMWGERDFAGIQRLLSQIGPCTSSGVDLAAEFALDATSARASSAIPRTALWTLDATQPHPECGAGLFCLLQLPHAVPDRATLDAALIKLNQMEMEPADRPPHFGAWCRSSDETSPAYLSFLPNACQMVPGAEGLATNLSVWASFRARWASTALASMGIEL